MEEARPWGAARRGARVGGRAGLLSELAAVNYALIKLTVLEEVIGHNRVPDDRMEMCWLACAVLCGLKQIS